MAWLTSQIANRAVLIVVAVLSLSSLPTAQADTPSPKIVLGPEAGDLRVSPKMNAVGRKLRGSQFVGQDLSEAVFDGCDLAGVLFWDCDLSRASFRHARLTGAVLDECRFEKADFTDATVNGLPFRESEPSSYLTPTQLVSTQSYKVRDLSRCVISGYDPAPRAPYPTYDFRGANLNSAILAHGDFRACDFTDARIDNVAIGGCTMDFAQLASTKNFKERSLREMNFALEFQGRPDFLGIDLTGTRLGIPPSARHASLKDATISRCRLPGITKEQLYSTKDYQRGYLQQVYFEQSDLSGCDFSRRNLSGCRFRHCNLTGTDLADAVISGVVFGDSSPLDSVGLTVEQIKSTWNYKQGRMEGIRLPKKIAEALARQ